MSHIHDWRVLSYRDYPSRKLVRVGVFCPGCETMATRSGEFPFGMTLREMADWYGISVRSLQMAVYRHQLKVSAYLEGKVMISLDDAKAYAEGRGVL